MNTLVKHIEESIVFIREHASYNPKLAIILGSGLGDFADNISDSVAIPTSAIPHYPISTVPGHKGSLVFAPLGTSSIIAFQGRIHLYESNDLDTVLYPIHIASKLGVETLIITNAAGGINRQFTPGDLMVITDQLDLTLECIPGLQGGSRKNIPLYDWALTRKLCDVAGVEGIRVRQGVYAGVKGPSYETAAEVEMINRLGGDAVGMSTVLEVGLASHLGIKVVGISCITNKATGIGTQKLHHAEVTEVANKVKHDFTLLLRSFITSI